MKRPRILLVIFLGMLACVALVLLVHLFSGEATLRRALYVYSNAQLRFEDKGHFGANVDLKGLYYWTPDALGVVKSSYEQHYPTFVSFNADSQWLITAYNPNQSAVASRGGSVLGHGSFCDYEQSSECATITLIDLGSQDVNSLSIRTVSSFAPDENSPLYKFLQLLPHNGTLILYKFYVSDF